MRTTRAGEGAAHAEAGVLVERCEALPQGTGDVSGGGADENARCRKRPYILDRCPR
jgi:hypothetical protein